MKNWLEKIISDSKEIIELAQCDIDCACTDFDISDYLELLERININLSNISETLKYIKSNRTK